MHKKKLLSYNPKKAKSLAFILFLAISFILFYLCRFLFFYDEDIFVVNSQEGFMSDFTRGAIVKFTFLVDNFFWETNPVGYHVTNILLHLCNTLLATYTFCTLLKFTVLDELKAKNAGHIFFFLFLLSPVHSESLCYLLGRAGLIVTLFCTLSLLFFLKANFKSFGLLLISLSFFFLALFSYEISWTFPLIIFLIANYLKQYQPLTGKKIFIYVAPFFIVFFFWLIIKIVFSNQLKITPYGNDIFFSFNGLRLIKNTVVLFFRNMVPPFKSTTVFVVLSGMTLLMIVYIVKMLKNKITSFLHFALLIIISCFLAYLPASFFGINSHNSESERYIYFSSVFAIMFLAIAISLLRNQQIRQFVLIAGCCIYASFLFRSINNYIQGGRFSKNYLKLLVKEQGSNTLIYLINQPSQYKGALLFRANGNGVKSSQENISTLRDFMYSLYKKNNSKYITLTKKELSGNDAIKNVVHFSIDSLQSLFPEFHLNKTKNILINSYTCDSAYFKNGSSMIVGLKLPSLYIFR